MEAFDLAIVGAGIIGLAHAWLAAKSGLRVVVFERNPAAAGASLRNFGMVWPIGQPAGPMHQLAMRSRDRWLAILNESNLPHQPTGSLHAVYRQDEAAVASEFAEKSKNLGYDCTWLNAGQTLNRTRALNPDGLLGALWSPAEFTVDPRLVAAQLPRFLRDRHGVEFQFNTAVQDISLPFITAADHTWSANAAIIAAGDDFQTLFPQTIALHGLTRCKLQMLRTVVQPVPQHQTWQLGPSLAFGLSFRHYEAFHICESLPALKHRIATETPELDRWGIHVMLSATADNAVTLGDSHQYGLEVDMFDRPEIDALILNFARQHVILPSFDIAQRWHGVYAKHPSEHPSEPYIRYSPARGVHGIIVTSGAGMTLSFGLAEQTLACLS